MSFEELPDAAKDTNKPGKVAVKVEAVAQPDESAEAEEKPKRRGRKAKTVKTKQFVDALEVRHYCSEK